MEDEKKELTPEELEKVDGAGIFNTGCRQHTDKKECEKHFLCRWWKKYSTCAVYDPDGTTGIT